MCICQLAGVVVGDKAGCEDNMDDWPVDVVRRRPHIKKMAVMITELVSKLIVPTAWLVLLPFVFRISANFIAETRDYTCPTGALCTNQFTSVLILVVGLAPVAILLYLIWWHSSTIFRATIAIYRWGKTAMVPQAPQTPV